ncbi:MAG: DUF4190 domain-containing protein [Acidobacteriota bacterium]
MSSDAPSAELPPAPAPTPATAGSAPAAGSQAVIALILGILGLASCQVLGPIAWYLGHQELQAIRASGRGSAQDEGMALAGKILGIIATVALAMVLAVGLVWILIAALVVLGTL